MKSIIGEGAYWADDARKFTHNDIFLTIHAHSSGKKNDAMQRRLVQENLPIAFQVPGINPMFLAEYVLRTLDENVDLTEALLPGASSIVALNGMKHLEMGSDPSASPLVQGGEGNNNSPKPKDSPGSEGGSERTDLP